MPSENLSKYYRDKVLEDANEMKLVNYRINMTITIK